MTEESIHEDSNTQGSSASASWCDRRTWERGPKGRGSGCGDGGTQPRKAHFKSLSEAKGCPLHDSGFFQSICCVP